MFVLEEQDTKCTASGGVLHPLNNFVGELLENVDEPQRGALRNIYDKLVAKLVQDAFNAGTNVKTPANLDKIAEIQNDTNFILNEIQTLLRDRLQ